jgi:hypothetical protein
MLSTPARTASPASPATTSITARSPTWCAPRGVTARKPSRSPIPRPTRGEAAPPAVTIS